MKLSLSYSLTDFLCRPNPSASTYENTLGLANIVYVGVCVFLSFCNGESMLMRYGNIMKQLFLALLVVLRAAI